MVCGLSLCGDIIYSKLAHYIQARFSILVMAALFQVS